MKNVILILLISTMAFGQSQTKRTLFLGNSLTYVNDLPLMASNIATSMGDVLIYDTHCPGGYTLYSHFNNATSINKIKQGNWDYVVLQGQSIEAAYDDNTVEQWFLPSAQRLDSVINESNPCGETAFYMTFAHKDGDNTVNPTLGYRTQDSLIKLRYQIAAQRNKAIVSPVGAVWHYLRDNYPSIELYDADLVHPSVAGTYAAACCFYTTLYQKNPLLIPFNSSLSNIDANIIKTAVKAIVFDNLTQWHIGQSDYPSSNFSATNVFNCTAPLTTNFINKSIGNTFATYQWYFGDGATSSLQNPTHTYALAGSYNVKLKINGMGSCTNYKDSVIKNAYIKISSLLPVPIFTVNAIATTNTITTGFVKQFTDISLRNPITWKWNFGDGGTSILQNPTHTFADTGVYNIKLIVMNCFGKDSIISPIHITPEYWMCRDLTTNATTGILYDVGGPNGNFIKNTDCDFVLAPHCADTVYFTMTKNYLADASISVYNGSSVAAPYLKYIHKNTPMPLTIKGTVGKLFLHFNNTYKYTTDSGFVAYWTSTPSITKPIANFTSSCFNDSCNLGIIINFTNSSTAGANVFTWNFGDGTYSSSEHPKHLFLNSGTYTVTLIATNCIGSDTLSKTITIKKGNIICADTTLIINNGNWTQQRKVFDSGGLSGNYQNNENCHFLIQSNSCSNISYVIIDSLKIDTGDTLSIYDGTNEQAPVLFKGNQITPNTKINGISRMFYAKFTSDNLGTQSGFSFSSHIGYGLIGNNLPLKANYTLKKDSINNQGKFPVHFYDLSLPSISTWLWDFGDGTTSTEINPIHYYDTMSNYVVKLVVTTYCGGKDSTVNSIFVGVDESLMINNLYEFSPNPANDYIYFSLPTKADNLYYKIVNLADVEIQKELMSNTNSKINISHLSDGLYIIRLFKADGTSLSQHKIIKQTP